MKVIIPVGISGSGKNAYYNKYVASDHSILIDTDQIRRDMFGSVNEQKNGWLVFKERETQLRDALEDGEENWDIYLSSMNLQQKGIKDVIKICEEYNTNFKIVLLDDSLDWELCQARVKKDIDSGVDRSRTYDVVVDDETPLIKKMHNQYKTTREWILENLLENTEMYKGN